MAVMNENSVKYSRLLTVLTAAFLLMLPLSISGAQIMAAGLILASLLWKLRERWNDKTVRLLAYISAAYVLPLLLIGVINGGASGAAAALGKVWEVLLLPACAAILPSVRLGRIWRGWIWLYVVSAIIYLVQFSLYGYAPHIIERYGFHSAPYIAALMLIAPFLLLIVSRITSRLDFVIVVLFGITIMTLNSRGAIICWIVGLLTVFAMSGASKMIRSKKFIISVGIFLVFILGFPGRWEISEISKNSSIEHRLVIWAETLRQVDERFWLGHGFDNLTPDVSWIEPKYRHYISHESNPHNSYLLIAHSSGALGYIVFAAFWATLGGILFKNALARPELVLPKVALGLFNGYLVAALADKTLFTSLPMLQFYFLAALALVEKQEDAAILSANREIPGK